MEVGSWNFQHSSSHSFSQLPTEFFTVPTPFHILSLTFPHSSSVSSHSYPFSSPTPFYTVAHTVRTFTHNSSYSFTHIFSVTHNSSHSSTHSSSQFFTVPDTVHYTVPHAFSPTVSYSSSNSSLHSSSQFLTKFHLISQFHSFSHFLT